MGLFWDLYLEKGEDRNNPYASPIRANDLCNLPPALLFTVEYDVLRDEGEQYGKRLVKRVFQLLQGVLMGSFMVSCSFLLIKKKQLKF
jgi:hypothetical protein